MDKIKFRAWHKQAKEMVYYGDGTNATITNTELESGEAWGMFFKARGPVYLGGYSEPMLFTNLLDIDERELWEEDIVWAEDFYLGDSFVKSNIGKIVWNDGAFWVVDSKGNKALLNSEAISRFHIKKLSDIFSNPELLK